LPARISPQKGHIGVLLATVSRSFTEALYAQGGPCDQPLETLQTGLLGIIPPDAHAWPSSAGLMLAFDHSAAKRTFAGVTFSVGAVVGAVNSMSGQRASRGLRWLRRVTS
jgi:hypothetical protein